MTRIKAWLLATRHTVRDYLDTVVLLERLGESAARARHWAEILAKRHLTGGGR